MPESLSRVEGFQSSISRLSPKQISGGASGEAEVQMEERKEAVSCLQGSQHLSCSTFLLILSIFVTFTTPTLSISLSLIVSLTQLLSFNVISFLSPSHAPHLPPPFSSSFTHLIFQCCFAKVCLLFQFIFFQLCLTRSPKSTLFHSAFLSFLLPGLSVSLSLLRVCCRAIPTLD